MATMSEPGPSQEKDERVSAVRAFNRFYTRQIGLLHKSYLDSSFSLSEMRVLYELWRRNSITATHISKELGLDTGYLSRMLLNFEKRGFIKRTPSIEDGRQTDLSLTKRGATAFEPYEIKANQETAALLNKLTADDQQRLVDAMHMIETILNRSKS
jgi:DNA-binding MarR family transcriptional regulator